MGWEAGNEKMGEEAGGESVGKNVAGRERGGGIFVGPGKENAWRIWGPGVWRGERMGGGMELMGGK